MFKSARWRSDKNKIKEVFKLQFHATQLKAVPGDALMISLVPADTGKPTTRLEKATVRDGNCYWENPVCETVKFFREPKLGKIHEKIYNFILSTGSSKAGLVGEASIDFACYAEATKQSTISLSLKNAKCDAILHVSVQRLQENVDQRQTEESEDVKISVPPKHGKSLSIGADEICTVKSTEDELKMISEITELNGNRRASSGSDLTMGSFGSTIGETPEGFAQKNGNFNQDLTNFQSPLNNALALQKTTSDVSTTAHEEQQSTQWDWLGGSAPEASTDDSSSSPRDVLSRESSQESSEVVIERLKTELTILSRQAEMSELELQTLRKQIVKEGKRGQDLLKEVVSLKEERDAIKEECEKMKAFQKRTDEAKVRNKLKFEGGDTGALFEELRQELTYEKDQNANLRLQLQKTQESNSELILAVRDLDEMLEQKNREMLSGQPVCSENAVEVHETYSKSESDDDEEQKALEELVKDHSDSTKAHVMEQRIMDLCSELEMYRRDKDELEVQMEQLALDYEIMKQENHDLSYKLEQSQLQEQLKMQYECSSPYDTFKELEMQIERLESELKNQSDDFSDSLATVTKLETHIRDLEEELEKQAQGFEADMEILTRAKVQQEQRAIQAEEALRKVRWQNANTAERLQHEFRTLSVQMASSFESNEKLANQALKEAAELRLQKGKLQEALREANKELQFVRDQYEAKLGVLTRQVSSLANQLEHMQSECEAKSKLLEDTKKQGRDIHDSVSQDILVLKEEIKRLKAENSDLSGSVDHVEDLESEVEQLKTSMKETEVLLEKDIKEKSEMENKIALLKKEVDILRSAKVESESVKESLNSDLDSSKHQCNELKHSLDGSEDEKEKLRRQICQLQADLKNKEEAVSSLQRKLKDSNNRFAAFLDGANTTPRNKYDVLPHEAKEIANLKEKIQLLEGHIKLKEEALETSTDSFLEKEKDLQKKMFGLESRLEELQKVDFALDARDEGRFDELVTEIASLKERNSLMEIELKDMQERYSEISLKFAEVEGERQQLMMKVRNLKNTRRG